MTFIRDPLWNNIRVEPFALRLVDTPVFQRLRYVRQLGLAHLVYPGATHSRFEHALGAYHLARLALGILQGRGELDRLDAGEAGIVRAAALLHDIGHYPFSHALEEIGVPHHEDSRAPADRRWRRRRAVARRVRRRRAGARHGAHPRPGASPLQGLISGSLDLDKIEYLKRDALMCGVPYGEIDVDRLLHSLVAASTTPRRARHIGVSEKGLSALESLLFAKYQMYRNVYWHHAVRSATAMYKRLVEDALAAGALDAQRARAVHRRGAAAELRRARRRPCSTDCANAACTSARSNAPPPTSASDDLEWIADGPRPHARAPRTALARRLGLRPATCCSTTRSRRRCSALDIPVRLRDGRVVAPDARRTARGDQPAAARRRALSVGAVAARVHEEAHVSRPRRGPERPRAIRAPPASPAPRRASAPAPVERSLVDLAFVRKRERTPLQRVQEVAKVELGKPPTVGGVASLPAPPSPLIPSPSLLRPRPSLLNRYPVLRHERRWP